MHPEMDTSTSTSNTSICGVVRIPSKHNINISLCICRLRLQALTVTFNIIITAQLFIEPPVKLILRSSSESEREFDVEESDNKD